MSGFCFNFNVNSDGLEVDEKATGSFSYLNGDDSLQIGNSIEEMKIRPAKEHRFCSNTQLPKFNQVPIDALKFYVVAEDHSQVQAKSKELASIISTSDLQDGVYEGGFKLWECAVDLVQFMHQQNVPLKGKKVMELGCGHGIPGIFALLQGAEKVVFSDYNEEVIELATIPNVSQNLLASGCKVESLPAFTKKAIFFSGDWELVSNYMTNDDSSKMDFIFSTDTLYTESVSLKLYQMIKRHLKPRDGIALIGAKKYYFGTGGSVQFFKDIVLRDGIFDIETIVEQVDCKSNIREILKMTFKLSM